MRMAAGSSTAISTVEHHDHAAGRGEAAGLWAGTRRLGVWRPRPAADDDGSAGRLDDYIAPEHISGEPHDARSDIYAVGVTLYEMITGRLPIEGTTHVQVIAGHLQHAPVPPEQINPKIPAALSATVMRALKKNPRERWQTAEAFLAALDEDGLRSTPAGDVSQVRVAQAPASREATLGFSAAGCRAICGYAGRSR